MDDLTKTVVLGMPNLAIALWTLYWCFRALDKRDADRTELVRQLLELATENARLHAQNGT